MHNRDFTRVAEILPNILKKIGLKQKIDEQEVISTWAEAAGEEIASKAKAVKFSRGVLYVHVEHGAWMQELRFMERELIGKIRDRIPNVNIKGISFRNMKRRSE